MRPSPMMRVWLAAALFAAAPAAAQAPESRPVRGTLGVEQGVRVLRLRGTPAEMGYAHGFLLAAEILEGLESYIVYSPVVGGPRNYEKRIVPKVSRQMTFLPEHEAELAAMLEGIRAASADGGRVPALDRPISLMDLKVLNSYGDWYQFACSSFSVWGPMTPDGQTITARNFDFPPGKVLEKSQLVIVFVPADRERKAWVNVSFPGVIGLVSGMNEAGVGMFVHDVPPPKGAEHPTGVYPRLLVMREAIETTGPDHAPEVVLAKARKFQTSMGNNLHVSAPWDGKNPPCGIIEYDGLETQNDGADLRKPGNGEPGVCCTNHYRTRHEASHCGRYSKISEMLAEEPLGRVDATRARAIMSSIVQNALFSRTLHTVIFFPAAKRFELMLSKDSKPATASSPVPFTLAQLIGER